MVEYCANPAWPEEWQFEYTYGAFYIFPPDEIREPIDALRRKHDPQADSYCVAHISVSVPLPQPLRDEGLTEIRAALHDIKPFEMTYGPLITYPPHPGVCYDVSPKDEFLLIRERLNACTAFAESNMSRNNIPPHITIAEFGLTYEASEVLRKELHGTVPVGKFWCDAIEYAVPDKDFYFARKLKIPLGTS